MIGLADPIHLVDPLPPCLIRPQLISIAMSDQSPSNTIGVSTSQSYRPLLDSPYPTKPLAGSKRSRGRVQVSAVVLPSISLHPHQPGSPPRLAIVSAVATIAAAITLGTTASSSSFSTASARTAFPAVARAVNAVAISTDAFVLC